MKKDVVDICRICGTKTKLTFEHVPPRASFNRQAVKVISADEILQTVTDPNRDPWDFEGLNYSIQQKGSGDYYLCEKCNNNTGKWYVPYYLEFLYGFKGAVKLPDFKAENILQVFASNFRPLAVFKQVMSMFCAINYFCPSDIKLKNFLLNKEVIDFDNKKYRIFMYVFAGGLQRISSLTGIVMADGFQTLLSEIVSPPLGFVLYIDLPENLSPYFQLPGCEITKFCSYDYYDIVDKEIILPIHECNIIFPGDYRTKNEIKQIMLD